MQIKIGSGIAQIAALAIAASFGLSTQAAAQVTTTTTVRNHAPVISGTPASAVMAGQTYNFQPTAYDADRNTLVFSVTSKPAWARLDKATGRFYGTPTSADVGAYEEIEISVSDGFVRTKLPKFSINVNANPVLGSAPTISGTPATSVVAGNAYSFQPGAMDLDGDVLTFSITGRPAWATLNKQTGRLTGTPTAAQVGTYANIEIAVSDGKNIRKLPKFSITVAAAAATPGPTAGSVTLSWLPPTQNVDGSALTDLAGYRIVYGTAPKQYTKSVNVGVGFTRYMIENLAPGTYYFSMIATNAAGADSPAAIEVSATL
jgi:hypothetical protein